MTDTDLIRRALKLASKIETKPEYKHPLQIACEDEAIGAEIIVLGSGDYPSMRNLADGARADLDAAASAIRGLVGALHFPPYPGLANRFMAGEIVTEKAGAGDGVEAPALRPETTSEHIARDIREGRFPEQSPVQMVPVEAPAHAEPVAWYTDDYLQDKSATTWDASVADRWRSKGWSVWPLYARPTPAPVVPAEGLDALLMDLHDLASDAYDFGKEHESNTMIRAYDAITALRSAQPVIGYRAEATINPSKGKDQ